MTPRSEYLLDTAPTLTVVALCCGGWGGRVGGGQGGEREGGGLSIDPPRSNRRTPACSTASPHCSSPTSSTSSCSRRRRHTASGPACRPSPGRPACVMGGLQPGARSLWLLPASRACARDWAWPANEHDVDYRVRGGRWGRCRCVRSPPATRRTLRQLQQTRGCRLSPAFLGLTNNIVLCHK